MSHSWRHFNKRTLDSLRYFRRPCNDSDTVRDFCKYQQTEKVENELTNLAAEIYLSGISPGKPGEKKNAQCYFKAWIFQLQKFKMLISKHQTL